MAWAPPTLLPLQPHGPASCLLSQGHRSCHFCCLPCSSRGHLLLLSRCPEQECPSRQLSSCYAASPEDGRLCLPSAMHSRWEPAQWRRRKSRHAALSTPVRRCSSTLGTGQKHQGHRHRLWEGAPGGQLDTPMPSTPLNTFMWPWRPSATFRRQEGRQKAGGRGELPLTWLSPPRPEGGPDT